MTAFKEHHAPEVELGVSQAVDQIHGRLRRYLEAQYHIRNSSLIEERLRLLNEAGAIAQKPYIEVTPAYEVAAGYDRLQLPVAMRALLVELAAWKPGVGVYPPYVHQAEALEAFFSRRGRRRRSRRRDRNRLRQDGDLPLRGARNAGG